jgi:hypothetical protein
MPVEDEGDGNVCSKRPARRLASFIGDIKEGYQ